MGLNMLIPTGAQVTDLADELASWQRDGLPMQLHPGDIGWYAMRGAETTAQSLRVWTDRGFACALGLLDGPDLIRLAIHPEYFAHQELAERIHADLLSADSRIFTSQIANIEARGATALGLVLESSGWAPAEAWTCLRRSLDSPVRLPDLTFRRVDAAQAEEWMEVHLQAFRGQDYTTEDLARAVQCWHTMTDSPLYDHGQCLTSYDPDMRPLAVAAVWSAGSGRPGILEPIAVHPEARGKGHGTAITLAAAAELRSLGASSALVGTPSSNVAAVNTYLAAEFTADGISYDWQFDFTEES